MYCILRWNISGSSPESDDSFEKKISDIRIDNLRLPNSGKVIAVMYLQNQANPDNDLNIFEPKDLNELLGRPKVIGTNGEQAIAMARFVRDFTDALNKNQIRPEHFQA